MITLREFKAQDAPFIINTLNDEQVTRYLSSKIPFPYTQVDADWWISQGSKNGIIKAIVVNGQFAGCIGITPGEFEYKRSGEIGYWLNKAYWGQGIITRAIELICNEAFASSHLNRIFGAVFAGNTGSALSKRLCLNRPFIKTGYFTTIIYLVSSKQTNYSN